MISSIDSSSYSARVSPETPVPERVALARREALIDAGLVRRFNAGDEPAFAEIVARHRERLFAVAFGVLHNRADADEIAQDALVRAYRALGGFRGDSSLATWLHRIALNLARNRYWYFFRRRRHASLSFDSAFSDENQSTLADLVASDAAGPARVAQAGEFGELVEQCMDRIGSGHRKILLLRNAEHWSYRAIGRSLGIKVGTVKSRIARARESLRVQLAAACPEFGPEAQPTAWFDPVRPGAGVEALCA
jgi:RNA polymerase sigma-70 factor (ECF subfamily)